MIRHILLLFAVVVGQAEAAAPAAAASTKNSASSNGVVDIDECGPCGGSSTCVNGANKYTCTCADGWVGGGVNTTCRPFCEFNKTSCDTVGQILDMNLLLDGSQATRCLNTSHENRTCKACDTAPCGSGGVCTDERTAADLDANSYMCLCDSNGWEGGGVNKVCTPVCIFDKTSCGEVGQKLASASCGESVCNIEDIRGKYCIDAFRAKTFSSSQTTFTDSGFSYEKLTDKGTFNLTLVNANHLRHHGIAVEFNYAGGAKVSDMYYLRKYEYQGGDKTKTKYYLEIEKFTTVFSKKDHDGAAYYKMHMYITNNWMQQCLTGLPKTKTEYGFEGPVSDKFKISFNNNFISTRLGMDVKATPITFKPSNVAEGLSGEVEMVVSYSQKLPPDWVSYHPIVEDKPFYARYQLKNQVDCDRLGVNSKLQMVKMDGIAGGINNAEMLTWGENVDQTGPIQSTGLNNKTDELQKRCWTYVHFPTGVWVTRPSDYDYNLDLEEIAVSEAEYTAQFTSCNTNISVFPGKAFDACGSVSFTSFPSPPPTTLPPSTSHPTLIHAAPPVGQRRLGSNAAALRAEGAEGAPRSLAVTEVTEVYRGSTNQFTVRVVRGHGHQVLIHEEDQAWSWGILLLLVGGIVMCAGGGMYARSGQRDEREERYIPVAADANDVHEPLVLKTQHMHGPRTKHT